MEKKLKFFEDLPKATMQREINSYLMEKGLTPFTAMDRANKSDLVAMVMNWNIETSIPLKDRA
jgi:hypothetical protein|tara:strand:+ start:53 stop:241 length:189 start_codon:yes stop_codon:yes gene_type:complete